MQSSRKSLFASMLEPYGGRSGLLNDVTARLKYRMGALGVPAEVDWAQVSRLVFICRGNVCRSPFAELIARQAGLPAISFGLHTDQGTAANVAACRVAANSFGIDMTGHRSRPLDTNGVQDGDLVLGMEPAHLRDPRVRSPGPRVQVSLLGLVDPRSRRPYLHDPYGHSDAHFERCFRFITATIRVIAGEWRKLDDSRLAVANIASRPSLSRSIDDKTENVS